MDTSDASTLTVAPRGPEGSRSARRLRRAGHVPAVVYGGGDAPQAVQIEALSLNRTLNKAGSIIKLDLDGSIANVLIKDTQRHPVTNAPMHVDFLRVQMDVAIQTTVHVEVTGIEEAPGNREGGVIEQVTREVTVEALPADIPESIEYSAAEVQIHDTVTLEALTLPAKVTLIDDPETVLLTCTTTVLDLESDTELELETELVGDGDGEEAAGDEDAGESTADAAATDAAAGGDTAPG